MITTIMLEMSMDSKALSFAGTLVNSAEEGEDCAGERIRGGGALELVPPETILAEDGFFMGERGTAADIAESSALS